MANYPLLSYGSEGEEVIKLQNGLNAAGANLKVDGIYGRDTQNAVSNYQRTNGLQVDGIAGNETLGHLYGTGLAQSTDTAAQTAEPVWDSKKDLNEAWQNYLNREAFSYDMASDPMYQQYRDHYIRQGQLAMEDTMGMASSLTGGYGNSYAQTAGQQAYQSYLQQLNNVMPQLYGAAYDRYQAEGEALYNEIALMEQRQQNNLSQLTSLMAMGYEPTDDELSAAGLTAAQATAIKNYYNPTTSTGSGSGYSYDTHGYTKADIKKLQEIAGITVDGIWGPETEAAYQAGYDIEKSERAKEFMESIYPESQHGAVERAAFGPHKNYVIYRIVTSDLSQAEKDYLTWEIGATAAEFDDLQNRGLI